MRASSFALQYPFWQLVASNDRATYAQINYGEVYAPSQIADQTILIDSDAAEALSALAREFGR